MIYYVTGGERSGKSRYAQELALELSSSPLYIATARNWDADFNTRIQRHQNERDNRSTSIEEEKYLNKIDLKGKVAVIDCVTLWLTNFYVDTKYNVQESLKEVKAELKKAKIVMEVRAENEILVERMLEIIKVQTKEILDSAQAKVAAAASAHKDVASSKSESELVTETAAA